VKDSLPTGNIRSTTPFLFFMDPAARTGRNTGWTITSGRTRTRSSESKGRRGDRCLTVPRSCACGGSDRGSRSLRGPPKRGLITNDERRIPVTAPHLRNHRASSGK
jgi:hypothetical protein